MYVKSILSCTPECYTMSQLNEQDTAIHTIPTTIDVDSVKITIDSKEVVPPFKLSAHLLSTLVDPKDPEKLQELGNVEGVAKALHTDLNRGINTYENEDQKAITLLQRRQVYGANVIPASPQRSIWSMIWDARHDKILVMLIIAAIVSLGMGLYEDFSSSGSKDKGLHWIEGASIFIAVILVVSITSFNDYQKEKQFRKLNAKKENRNIKILRDGMESQISVHDILVGDVVILEPGDLVCADGIVIESHLLSCDESGATGESDAIKKGRLDGNRSSLDPFLLSGTKVIEGVGKFLVIAVGKHSMNGRLLMSLQEEKQDTPLQMKLYVLAEKIAKTGSALAVTMLLTLLIKFIITESIDSNGWKDGVAIATSFLHIFMQAITIMVVAIPEGLPMAVTIALAYGTSKMLQDNNLVRVLAACETMGNATTICSDKTGTLTTNVMTVVKSTIAQTSQEDQEAVVHANEMLPKSIIDLLIEGIAINSTAFETKDGESVGSKTEIAMLNMIRSWMKNRKDISDYQTIRSGATIVQLYPFSSQRKSMTTVIQTTNPDGEMIYRLYCKGASEIVSSFCSHMISNTGQIARIDAEEREYVKKSIQRYASDGLRTISISYRDYLPSEFEQISDLSNAPCSGQVLLGVVGIEDPVRPGVPEAVLVCQNAGIFVRMVTGDNLTTASSIAKRCNILMRGGIAMEGPHFRQLDDASLTEVIPKLQVLARSSPIDKQILVRKLKEMNEVVAVTGDGTNDGPALKAADVGFSMGITGTEVAKEASSIILMDDNFTSIVKAVGWGRCINDSVRKFLQFQLTVNVAAVIIAFVTAIFDHKNESVLTVLQLLWINLIMDTCAALALATERPSPELLNRHPDSPKRSLVTFGMAKLILGQAALQILMICLIMYLGPAVFHLDKTVESENMILKTIGFNTFVMMQLFNEINSRILGSSSMNPFRKFFSNYTFIGVMLFTIGGQILIVELGGRVFHTEPLKWYYWLICIMIGALSLPWAIVLRLIPDWRTSRSSERVFLSKERLQWQATVADIRHGLSVFNALRRPKASYSSTASLVTAVVPHGGGAINFDH